MLLRSALPPAIFALVAVASSVVGCSSDDPTKAPDETTCAALPTTFRFPGGTDGHADPFGAKAASQARAGKITRPEQIVQEAGAKHKVRLGDFVIANDKIAAYVEAAGESDGLFPFGGDLLGIEPVGDDGLPKGVSRYGESTYLFGIQTVAPDSVTVLNDGSDGKAAVVRASGVLKTIPFLETFRILSSYDEDLPAAIDYVLEPGAEKVTVRVSLANTNPEPVDFSSRQFFGFFHTSRSRRFVPAQAFAESSGPTPFIAWDSGETGFAIKPLENALRTEFATSGFELFSTPGRSLDACSQSTFDYVEVVTATAGLDGVLDARRRVDGEPAHRAVTGHLKRSDGTPVAGALVHATTDAGAYLTRATTGADGAFVVHLPPGAAKLVPTVRGWSLPAGTPVADGATAAEITLPPHGTIDVTATDATSGEPLPVRVQVIPESPAAFAPASFGVSEPLEGRLWQEYAVTGRATLPVPPGNHRVVVSRGFRFEIVDTVVAVTAGATTPVTAQLARSVPADGTLCADFHIHSIYSNDSSDPVDDKVRGAVADGLDIAASSDHEYINDFAPVVQRLGLEKWAFGMGAEELTTFTYGHFGVVPLSPAPDAVNNGALSWYGRTPDEVFQSVLARPEAPALIVNHPRSTGFEGYFGVAQFDRATGVGTPSLWSEAFSAVEVFNHSDFDDNKDESVADYFALLNAGKTFSMLGNSDSHDQRARPVGYPRTCFRLGDDPRALTPNAVRDVLKAGHGVVSGGLTMKVTGPGGAQPGDTSQAGDYAVEIRAPGWIAAKELEVYVDGELVQTLALTTDGSAGPGKRYAVTAAVAPQSSRARHFVVFHARGQGDLSPVHPGEKVFAVSNPIFF